MNGKEKTIDKEDKETSQAPLAIGAPKSKESTQTWSSETEGKASGSAEKGEVIDFDYYRETKSALKEKLENALERNREATARQDPDAKESTRQEYLEFSKQIIALGDELKRKNKGVLPYWWEE